MLNAPKNAPKNNLFILERRLNTNDTASNKIKSKAKLSKNNKSQYTFISSPKYIIKKQQLINCRFNIKLNLF